MPVRTPWEDKFTMEPNTGCWLWLGAVAGNGRAYVRDVELGTNVIAPRYSWKLRYGQYPEGELHHICFTPLCVNPDHLKIVTRHENLAASGLSKIVGHEDEITQWLSEGLSQKEIARRVGCDCSAISHFKRGYTGRIWRRMSQSK